MRAAIAGAAAAAALVAAAAHGRPASTPVAMGRALYAAHCAMCHDRREGAAPSREALGNRLPSNIVMTLETGAMRPQAAGLSLAQVGAVAAFLTAGQAARAAQLHPDRCRGRIAPLRLAATGWNGWGRELANSRFQPDPGLTARDVPRLRVRWAFAYPGLSTWGEPTVVGGRVFVASTTGWVYALDARTGCTVWRLHLGAPVRSAISIGPGFGGHGALAYFGDLHAVMHAVDANTGARVWRVRVARHPFARITGSPVLFRDRLFVPVSSLEEAAAAASGYHCCTFRGSVVALDAASGRMLWTRHTIARPAIPYRRKGDPTLLYGPAGAAVWDTPTLDPARGVLYVGTGDDYTDISAPTADAVMALDLATGKVRWVRQLRPHDHWTAGCSFGGPCPQPAGPDADIGGSVLLVKLASGRDVLVAGAKSGVVYGLDPDQRGRLLWQKRVGAGGLFGGIEWGMAAIGGTVYVPISDSLPTHPADAPHPGLAAVSAATGKLLWWAPAPRPARCSWGPHDCRSALSQAITVMPGVVFAGSQDGHLRAYDASDGRIIWDFDTGRPFPAVDAEWAHGGSLDAGGPVLAGGALYVNSGYGQLLGRGGDALLALGVTR